MESIDNTISTISTIPTIPTISTIPNNYDNDKITLEEVYKLETELENIENQYNKQLLTIIKTVQTIFYKKYGSKIQTLEDLQDYINSEQKKGLRLLKRKLQQIFIQADGDFDTTNELDFKTTVDQLLQNYKSDSLPKDNYQIKIF